MAESTVTTKIWKKTHTLAKTMASAMQVSIVWLVHQALLEYGRKYGVADMILRRLKGEDE